jgi:hypothetical protein
VKASDNVSISKKPKKSPSDTIKGAITGLTQARVDAMANPSNMSESLEVLERKN